MSRAFRTYDEIVKQQVRVDESVNRSTPEWIAFEQLKAFRQKHNRMPGQIDKEARPAFKLLKKLRQIADDNDRGAGFHPVMVQEARRLGVFEASTPRQSKGQATSAVIRRLQAGDTLQPDEIKGLEQSYRQGRLGERTAVQLKTFGINVMSHEMA